MCRYCLLLLLLLLLLHLLVVAAALLSFALIWLSLAWFGFGSGFILVIAIVMTTDVATAALVAATVYRLPSPPSAKGPIRAGGFGVNMG